MPTAHGNASRVHILSEELTVRVSLRSSRIVYAAEMAGRAEMPMERSMDDGILKIVVAMLEYAPYRPFAISSVTPGSVQRRRITKNRSITLARLDTMEPMVMGMARWMKRRRIFR